MFDRKRIKRISKANVFKNYFRNVIVVFIFSLIIQGGFKYSTNNEFISDTFNKSKVVSIISKETPNTKIIDETIDNFSRKKSDTLNKSKEYILYKTKHKYTKGIFSMLINQITKTGSIILGSLNVINKIVFDNKISEAITIIISTLITIFIAIFIKNITIVGKNRYFLEQRKYYAKADKLLFLVRVKRSRHAAFILFKMQIYEILWSLTIIGGFIKRYEYKLIPYILAENPNIDSKSAFLISKKLTSGNKLLMFKLDLSMIGWFILKLITFNLSSIFFSDIYYECIYANLYIYLRNKVGKKSKFKNYFNDEYLDIKNSTSKFYPNDKYVIKSRRNWLIIDDNEEYSIKSYILLFFSFSIIGWVWEVTLHLITTGNFVNRGTLYGPWLPIYGTGGLLMLILLKPFKNKPYLYFISSIILCGTLEYFTGLYLEVFKHMKWWDYSGFFLNLHGRICAEGLIAFGLLGMSINYYASPLLNRVFKKLGNTSSLVLCIFLCILFSFDFIYSSRNPNIGKGVAKNVYTNLYNNVIIFKIGDRL